jgi:hypothetical protein
MSGDKNKRLRRLIPWSKKDTCWEQVAFFVCGRKMEAPNGG